MKYSSDPMRDKVQQLLGNLRERDLEALADVTNAAIDHLRWMGEHPSEPETLTALRQAVRKAGEIINT